jgi:hypothetical protein
VLLRFALRVLFFKPVLVSASIGLFDAKRSPKPVDASAIDFQPNSAINNVAKHVAETQH